MRTNDRSFALRWLLRASFRWPALVLAAWSLVVAASAVSLSHIQVDTTTSSFLDRSDADWKFYQSSLDTFGGDEFLTIAVDGGEAFDAATLRLVSEWSSSLEAVEGVRRVDSLDTVPVIRATPDGALRLDPALRGLDLSRSDVFALLQERLSGDRISPRSLISRDAKTFALNVILDEAIDGPRGLVVKRARELVQGHDAWVSGVPLFRTEVNSHTQRELTVFVPVTLLLAGAVIAVALTSIWAIFVALVSAVCGTILALGAMAEVGTPLSLSTAILPPVLIALGCAYVMHVLTAARGSVDRADLERRLLYVSRPVALSGLTTVIGFLAMATVRVDAIRDLARFGALGAFTVLLAALSLAPALLRLRSMPRQAGRAETWLRDVGASWLSEFVERHGRGILVVWGLSTLLMCFGLARLWVETDIILWFPPKSDARQSYEEIRGRLSGITPVNVVVDAGAGARVTDPEILAAIAQLTEALEARQDVGRALSVADPLRQIHEGFTGTVGGLPPTREMAEQYLLLLSSVDQMNDVISEDRTMANILVRADVNGSRRIGELAGWVAGWWRQHGVGASTARMTGVMYEFARAEEEISRGQIRGLALAFGAIGLILFAVLRHGGAAIAALIPNVIPVAMAYGLMGLLGIPLDSATICLGCIALGIAVDDTIHIIVGYRDHRLAGAAQVAALRGSFERVLPAVVFTTVALVCGFLVLAVSEFTLVRNFGFVTSGMVAVCLVADVTLLPALLLYVRVIEDDR